MRATHKSWFRRVQTLVFLLIAAMSSVDAAQEHSFPVLQIGTRMYTNVTVTTKAKDYIFILHSTGMQNVKVDELSEELRAELGYGGSNAVKKASNWGAAAAAMPKIDKAEVEKLEKQINLALGPNRSLPPLFAMFKPWMLYAFLGVCLLFHLFFSYCSMLICQKTGHPPGVLVWIPILQMIPLLKAAGMSPFWFLAMFVPVLNLIAQIMWIFKIVQARGKGIGVAILMLVPLLNVLAFCYLAFSNGNAPSSPAEKVSLQPLMTLETA